MNAGMRELIEQDQVALASQRRNDSGIGEIAGAEDASSFASFEAREFFLECPVERVAAGDEPGRARAGAIMLGRLRGRLPHCRMLAEIEIVVAAEREQRAAIADHP